MILFEIDAETLSNNYHTALVGCLGVGFLLLFFLWISSSRTLNQSVIFALIGYVALGFALSLMLKKHYLNEFISATLKESSNTLELAYVGSQIQTFALTEIKKATFGKSGKAGLGCYIVIYFKHSENQLRSGKANEGLDYCKISVIKLNQALSNAI